MGINSELTVTQCLTLHQKCTGTYLSPYINKKIRCGCSCHMKNIVTGVDPSNVGNSSNHPTTGTEVHKR